ncbi:hypothetical protein LINPERPRIM_LOCUS15479 [Linum perenne]
MTKWVCRPPGIPAPEYDLAKEDLFTIEMHYNGIMSGDDYIYGSVACIDQVDPDYLSMIELTLMADFVNVEGDLYQFLWPKPGQGIGDGLSCIECEDDVLAFIKARKNVDENGTAIGVPFRLMKVYVKKLSEFEARKRIGQIKMDLFRATFQRRVPFRLEEINEDGDLEGPSGECSDSGLVSRNDELCLSTVVVPANEGVQTHYLPLHGADFVETPCEVPEVVAHRGDAMEGVPVAMNDTCADLGETPCEVPEVVVHISADLDGGPQDDADLDGGPQDDAHLDGGPQADVDDTCADMEGVPQHVDDRSAHLEGVPQADVDDTCADMEGVPQHVFDTSAELDGVLEDMINVGADLEDVQQDGVVNAGAVLEDVPQDGGVNAGANLEDVPQDLADNSAGPRWLGVEEVLAEMAPAAAAAGPPHSPTTAAATTSSHHHFLPPPPPPHPPTAATTTSSHHHILPPPPPPPLDHNFQPPPPRLDHNFQPPPPPPLDHNFQPPPPPLDHNFQPPPPLDHHILPPPFPPTAAAATSSHRRHHHFLPPPHPPTTTFPPSTTSWTTTTAHHHHILPPPLPPTAAAAAGDLIFLP